MEQTQDGKHITARKNKEEEEDRGWHGVAVRNSPTLNYIYLFN